MDAFAVSASPDFSRARSLSTLNESAKSEASPQPQAGNASQDDQALQDLKARDAEVRQHEQAHLAAAGGLAQGGASYTYERGSDGLLYAVGGEVSIDVSAASTPTQTLAKAQQIRAAALAPADPSPQDRAVAAAAGQLESAARAELAQQQPDTAKQGGVSPATQNGGSAGIALYQQVRAQTALPVSRWVASA